MERLSNLRKVDFKKIEGGASDRIQELEALVQHQQSLIERLEQQANEDALTGVANRRAFEKDLDRALAHYLRYSREGALLVLDMNDFKTVNDSLGHLAGDAILKHVAALLRTRTRQSDTVARIGGDEFAVILREVSEADVRLKVEELAEAIANTPCFYEGREIYMGASIGYATFEQASHRQTLIECADTEMYKAKKNKDLSIDPQK